MNAAILKLKEDGGLKALREKWWEPKEDENGVPYNCDADKKAEGTKSMDISNVGGVFIVLIIGVFVSFFLGVLEFLWAVRQTSIECKVI